MFKDVDVIVFLGGFPRKPGMERKDLLQKNKDIFVVQSKALHVAKPDVKCLVVANPANTNAYILGHFAEKIKKENITCLSRLDHNRAISQIAEKTGAKYSKIEGVMIFGNHSTTQYPCIKHIKVDGKPISELVEKEWLETTYITKVQKRGGEVLEVRGGSSVFSAANAVVDHLRDWYQGSDKIVSMGVVSDGSYGVPEGLISSFPVRCKDFGYEIVKGFELSEFCKEKISVSVKELQGEIEDAQL
jgi:malate dehydrogenase